MGRFHAARATTFCLVVLLTIFSVQLMYGPNQQIEASRPRYQYKIVPGIFSPSEAETNPDEYDFVSLDDQCTIDTQG